MIKFLAFYFLDVSILTVFITVLDKQFAKHGKRRVSEATLLTFGFIGGALAEYITMKIIRHKTLHKKFMYGLPAEIVFHVAILIFIIIKTAN